MNGDAIEVKVAPFGERSVAVNVANGTSVREILNIAEVSVNGRSIMVNGQQATEDTAVHKDSSDMPIVTLATQQKGGCVA